MFESQGYALLKINEGQRQIGLALWASLVKAWRRAGAILARQAQIGGFMS